MQPGEGRLRPAEAASFAIGSGEFVAECAEVGQQGGKLAPDRLRVLDYCRMGPSDGDRRTADAWMPFFTRDALPDQDLADVAAMIDGQKW